jgi:hypothetical protein
MKYTKKDKQLYIQLCDEVDDILIKSGVRKVCVRCSTIKPYRYKKDVFKGFGLKLRYDATDCGCCQCCKHLTSNGCSTKALACKMWLCSPWLGHKIEQAGFKERFNELLKIAQAKDFLRFRYGLEDYFPEEAVHEL